MSLKVLSSRAIIGHFFHRLAQLTGKSWVSQVSMKFLSDQESETYKWLGMVPQMREWIGARQAHGFRDFGLTITNKDFEATLEVLTKDLRRDKTGQTLIRIGELAKRTLSHDAKLLTALIESGTTATCYDGQFFFDTDHTEGDSGTQDNDLTVSIVLKTAPTVAEMITAITRCINAILAYKDDQGEPMNEDATDFMVMVPAVGTFSASTGSAINDAIVNQTTNALKNQSGWNVNLQVNPRLSWTDKFSVFRTDSDVSPLIIQLEKDIEIAAIAEGSELEFNEKKHHYGVDKSGNVGFGFWQMACLHTFTTT